MFSKLSKKTNLKKPQAKRLDLRKANSIFLTTLWVGMTYVVASGAAYLVILIAGKLGWLTAQQETIAVIIGGLVTYAVSIVLLFFGIHLAKKYPEKFRLLGIKKADWAFGGWLTWQQLFLGLAAFVVSMIAMVVVLSLVSQIFPGFNLEEAQDLGISPLAVYRRYEMLAVFALLVVIGPIAEELVFRGYLYGKLRQFSSVVTSVLITSLLFGLVHLQPNVAVATFVMSVVMCLCREATGSIYPAIIIHMLKNGIAFALLFMMKG